VADFLGDMTARQASGNSGGFGLYIPNLVQKWLGHAQLSTTAVYANVVGVEEKDVARRMWD
jgi:integrase